MVDSHQLKIGQVIYFCERTGFNYTYQIHFGIVDDIFSDKCYIKRLVSKETRLINGIPYDDFETPTHWQKLPKKWTYNTELFKLTYDESSSEYLKNYRIDKTDDVLKAIADGYLIPMNEKDQSHIEAEIDSKLGWRLIRKADTWKSSYVSYNYSELFYTYKNAKNWIDDYNTELKRQAALSDVDWSLEQIEHTVNRFVAFHYPDEEVREERKNKIMEWFKTIKKIEDVETRLSVDTIQWKYWKNKKWVDIDPNLL